jgi:uncharacterized membrane protein YkgB
MGKQTLERVIISRQAAYLEVSGLFIIRYGLVAMLLLFGLQKWTNAEALAIRPWVSHSPLMFWLYHVTSIQRVSIDIGLVELTIAVMILSRRWFPRIAAIGSAIAVIMFLTTLSFLITTPNLGPSSQAFLIKDIFLLGTSIWSTGEALAHWCPRPQSEP